VGDHKSKMNIIPIISPYLAPVRRLTIDKADLAGEQGSVLLFDNGDRQGMLALR
jgi:hypothetical protein